MDFKKIRETAERICRESKNWEQLGYHDQSHCRQAMLRAVPKTELAHVKQYIANINRVERKKAPHVWNFRPTA